MIDMLPVDARMLKPPLQKPRIYKMRNVAATEFPCDADVEPERKNLVELVSRNIFSADDGTARAVIVVAELKTIHEVTCANRTPRRKRAWRVPGSERLARYLGRDGAIARTQASASEPPQVRPRRLRSGRASSRCCPPSQEDRESLVSDGHRQSGSEPNSDRR